MEKAKRGEDSADGQRGAAVVVEPLPDHIAAGQGEDTLGRGADQVEANRDDEKAMTTGETPESPRRPASPFEIRALRAR